MKRALLVLAILGSFASPLWARQWTSRAGGFSVEAELLDVRNGNAVLKRADGSELTVPINKLSLADVRYIEETLRAADARLTGKEATSTPAAETPASEAAPTSAALNLDKLRYAWKPGQSYLYRVTLSTENGDNSNELTGDISYQVTAALDDGFEVKVSGGQDLLKVPQVNAVAVGPPWGPPFPVQTYGGSFYLPTSGECTLIVDAQGRVVQLQGSRQLANLLGEQARLILEPLPSPLKASWTDAGDTGVSIVVSLRPLYRFAPSSRIEFREGKVDATEKATYTVESADEKLITVAKHYELTTSSLVAGKPRIEATGNGKWKFDVQRGVPSSLDYKLRITTRERNTTEETPVRLRYRLLSEEEQARLAKEAEDAKREKERPLTEAELTKAVAELRSGDRERVATATKLLAEKAAMTAGAESATGLESAVQSAAAAQQLAESTAALNGEVAAALEAVTQSDAEGPTRENAFRSLRFWSRPESEAAVVKGLSDPWGPVRNAALETLGKYDVEKYLPAIAPQLPEGACRDTAAKLLKRIGPAAEEAVLLYTEGNDAWLQCKACTILADIGTQKSLPIMEKLANDSNWMIRGEAKKAADAIKVRIKLAPKKK